LASLRIALTSTRAARREVYPAAAAGSAGANALVAARTVATLFSRFMRLAALSLVMFEVFVAPSLASGGWPRADASVQS
jgi:hypothetical protein